MKTYLLILLTVGIVTISRAQDTIRYNFKDNKLVNDRKKQLDYGKTYQYIIEDINLANYTITDKTIKTDWYTTVPAALKNLKLPAMVTGINIDVGIKIKTLGGEDECLLKRNLPKSAVNEAAIVYKNVFEHIRNLKSINTYADLVHLDCISDYRQGQNKILSHIKFHYGGCDLRANNYQQTISLLIQEAFLWNEYFLVNYDELFQQVVDQRKKEVSIWEQQNKGNGKNINDNKIVRGIKKLEKEYPLLKKNAEAMKSEGLFLAVKNNLLRYVEENFTYVAQVFKADSDEVKFILDVTAKQSKCPTAVNQLSIQHEYRVRNGIKLDFSSGVFANMGNKDFLTRVYEYKKLPGDSTQKIVEAPIDNKAVISIGALAHFYWRLATPVNFALSVGSSVATGLDNLHLHAGGSLLIRQRNRNRFILSAGATWRSTDILSPNYTENTEQSISSFPDEIPTIRKNYCLGWFLSATYNLISVK